MLSIDKATQQDIVRVAHLLADVARVQTLRLFRTPDLVSDDKSKPDAIFDPVTEADRAAEAAMRAILEVERPDDGILGEEMGTSAGTSGLTWVLDPIDGTRGYISGTPTWGVLIAVSNVAGPQFGIIYQPYIGERFVGGFGHATLTGPHGTTPLVTRARTHLPDATLLSTFPEVGTPLERRAFEAVSKAVKLTRYGMDCYGYALLAAGQVDLVIEAGLQPYDIHAPIAVIKAAGGIVSNWQGGVAHLGGRVIAAANADVHAVALATLQEIIDG